MNKSSSRDIILQKIKRSVQKNRPLTINLPEFDTQVFPLVDDLFHTFKAELEIIKGQVFEIGADRSLSQVVEHILKERNLTSVFCIDENITQDLSKNIVISDMAEFNKMEVGITTCEVLIARSGSIFISSAQPSGRRLNVYPPIHIVVANKTQIVPFIEDGLSFLEAKYLGCYPSLISLISGPSRTADIEKTLVMGAHGPKELIVIFSE